MEIYLIFLYCQYRIYLFYKWLISFFIKPKVHTFNKILSIENSSGIHKYGVQNCQSVDLHHLIHTYGSPSSITFQHNLGIYTLLVENQINDTSFGKKLWFNEDSTDLNYIPFLDQNLTFGINFDTMKSYLATKVNKNGMLESRVPAG